MCTRIAVVDDEEIYRSQLQNDLKLAAKNLNLSVSIRTFGSAFALLDIYEAEKTVFDILFLDIDMGSHMDGLEMAKRIRQFDSSVCIIFVTNLSQYAIRGYEVQALDFVVKPVTAPVIEEKLKRALSFCQLRQEKHILLSRDDTTYRITYSQIFYIEKEHNYLTFHTKQGDFYLRGTFSKYEDDFLSSGFGKCNRGCIINYDYVEQIEKNDIVVGGTPLAISRSQRKPLLDGLAHYWGGVGA